MTEKKKKTEKESFSSKPSPRTCFHSRSSCEGGGGEMEEMIESRNGTCRSLIEYDMLGEGGHGRGVRQEGVWREPRDEEEDEDEEEEELLLSCRLSPHRRFLHRWTKKVLAQILTDASQLPPASPAAKPLAGCFLALAVAPTAAGPRAVGGPHPLHLPAGLADVELL